LIGSTRFEMHSEGDVSIIVDSVVLLDSLSLSNEAVAKQHTEENIWTRLSDGGVLIIIES